MSKHLETEMENLRKKLMKLTSLVETVVLKATEALLEKDKPLAKEVIDTDYTIDQLEVEIEEDCLKILALHQPVAIDLRYLVGILKVNNDLERIGDLAVNISERTLYIIKEPEIMDPYDITEMSRSVLQMLKISLDALFKLDLDRAREVMSLDDHVDKLNREMYKNVYAAIKESPQNVVSLLNYVSASRHLERIGDYTTNIAEDIIYMVEGTIVRHSPELFE